MEKVRQRGVEEITAWLVAEVAKLARVEPQAIDPHEPLTSYLTDSRDALNLAADFQDWLGVELSAYVIWDHPTIAALADHVAKEVLTPGGR